MEQVIAKLLQKLSTGSDALSALQEIKAFIAGVSSSSLKNHVRSSQMVCLFDCLNTTNREQIEITCYILKALFPLLDPNEVVNDLSMFLQNALKHQNSVVQHFALHELHRIIESSQSANALSTSSEVIELAIKLIGDKELSVASAAVQFLSDFARISPAIAKTILGKQEGSHLKALLLLLKESDEVRYRVFELICNIQSESQEMLDLCVSSGVLDFLINDLSGNDVLLKVTCCAMLSDMASSRHSLDYLEQCGVVSQMVELLKNSSSEPMSDLYLPGIIKFFGNLCVYTGPERVLSMYPKYCDNLFTLLDNGDVTQQRIAIQTIGVIAATAEGKRVLNGEGRKFKSALEHICKILNRGMQDVRLYAVNAMCQMLDLSQVNKEEIDEISKITLSWFRLISESPIDTVISLCKVPFPAIRCSGLHLLKTVASCNWGIEAMVELATLTEYLLDRSTETEKECKEAKFEVVTALCKNASCASVFGNQNYLKFRQFVNEGPFYVESQMNVAIEEA